MNKSTRALVGLVMLEAITLGSTACLARDVTSGAIHARYPGTAIMTIAAVGGAASGVMGTILLLAFFLHRRHERQEAARPSTGQPRSSTPSSGPSA